MTSLQKIACPTCGAPLSADAAHGPTTCPFCGAAAQPPPAPVVVERVVERVVVSCDAGRAPDGPRCPRCARSLEEARSGAKVVCVCTRCGGVWVDKGTAEYLTRVSDPDLETAVRRAVGVVMPVRPDVRRASVFCPVCEQQARRVEIRGTIFTVDVCDAHGTWFDCDELPMFAQSFRDERAGEVSGDDLASAGLPGAGAPAGPGLLSSILRSLFGAALLVGAGSLAACGDGPAMGSEAQGPSPEGEVTLGQVALALGETDPVSAAVDASCTTSSVKGLATQLVGEIQCMRPGSMRSIEGAAGLSLGAAVFPFLQAPAADALLVAQRARGVTMALNSALRTLPQQYLLYRWYQTGVCGISLAAEPGKSNHEGALAVDVDDAQAWRSAMTDAGFRWLGSSDPVHFDYVGADAVDMNGLSVKAFQRLWNRNHPDDRIDEDGLYGTETEKRLARAPVGGFARGADGCAGDAGPAPAPPAVEPAPAAAEPAPSDGDDGGCSVSAQPRPTRGAPPTSALAGAALALLLIVARARPRGRALL